MSGDEKWFANTKGGFIFLDAHVVPSLSHLR